LEYREIPIVPAIKHGNDAGSKTLRRPLIFEGRKDISEEIPSKVILIPILELA
jgi:hypothetical protein